MAVKEFGEELKRASLGRVAFIGEVYDARTESFSSLSLLRPDHSKDLVKSTDTDQTEFEYEFTENSSDRFELLGVEGELQLSCLLGLIRGEGSGKFLTEEKKSRKTVSCSLKCKIHTKNEKLIASTEDYIKHSDLTVLQDLRYTHVITEINWGANCLLNLELTCESEASKQDLKGQLDGELKKVISVKGKVKLEKEKSAILTDERVKIKVFADVRPEEGFPTTVDGFLKFVRSVPDLLKNVNQGKGKPLSYTMIPLSGIRQMGRVEIATELVVRKIDESFLTSTIYFFSKIEEAKLGYFDLCELLNRMKKYVKDEHLTTAREKKAQLEAKESELKTLISEKWASVRSGDTTLKDLSKRIEDFKYKLQLCNYEAYLESFSGVVEKLSFVSDSLSKGISYLGKGEKFATLQIQNRDSEFVVMVTSSEMQKEDPDLYTRTCCYFFTLVEEARPETKYAVVDFDFVDKQDFSKDSPTASTIFHLKGIELLSRDMLRDYIEECECNFVLQMSQSNVDLSQHRPGNRVALQMTCPGVRACRCSSKVVEWKCYSCRADVEYGFDKFYYCRCGKSPALSFTYRCADRAKHGTKFVAVDEGFLKEALQKLSPLDEMNVLVIGQSGVGKSTWINSIVNYLSYESFEAARENGVICTIPAEITIYHPDTGEKRTFKVGNNENENEVLDTGHSATQHAVTYTFRWEGRCVRIIDTPGLADPRGIHQDRANLRNIMDHIGHFQVLHGVCILLKANDNKFNAIFTYSIKELLVNLHKSVTKNIVFCFTCSRTSLYSPGQAGTLLEKIIKDINIEKELGLGRHNMFCLDNEAFTFLCTLQYTNFVYNEVITKSFVESWGVSINETKRLFGTIKTFQPHKLVETLSLVKARNQILFLTKPIAEVSKTIQINVVRMEQKKKEIESSKLTIQDLRKKLKHTVIKLEAVKLDKPRTVCTSPSCVVYIPQEDAGVTEIEYKTHCHKTCFLENVSPKTINNAILKNCDAMKSDGNCEKCGCSWSTHMHLTYEQKRVPVEVENKYIRENITREEKEQRKIEDVVKDMAAEIKKYKDEQDIIIKASVKFGKFLKENAITVYNDSLEEYLQYLIQEAESNPCKSVSDKLLLKNLRDTLDSYHQEVNILTGTLNQYEKKEGKVTLEDVQKIEEELYKLELTGEEIRRNVEESRSSAARARMYTEVPISLSKTRTSQGDRTNKSANKSAKGNWLMRKLF